MLDQKIDKMIEEMLAKHNAHQLKKEKGREILEAMRENKSKLSNVFVGSEKK